MTTNSKDELYDPVSDTVNAYEANRFTFEYFMLEKKSKRVGPST